MNTTNIAPASLTKMEARAVANRLHAIAYSFAILCLLYQHYLRLLQPTTSLLSFLLYLPMSLADLILAFMWTTSVGFRWRPVRRVAFPEYLRHVGELPDIDVFICTADPYKEPPMTVVNTALSVMAFDYPADKVSVYISDDGGSELTLFAFMEAAKFAKHWLPFCRENMIQDRCPEVYFKSVDDGHGFSSELKKKYEEMKNKVEEVVERGRVSLDLLFSEDERKTFEKYYWSAGFSRHDHPSIIRVLSQRDQDVDHNGHKLPNLVYVTREKRKSVPHQFKAGALNALLRVSGAMSNSPIVLTLDCDMYCNDPLAAQRALCFLLDPSSPQTSKIAYVQYPQIFPGLNFSDIYAGECKKVFQINPLGMNGYGGPNFAGTGCFFRRRAMYGPPSSSQQGLEEQEVATKGPISSLIALKAAEHASSCTYEEGTKWGHLMGFRYGSLAEDFHTGYRLICEGWTSVFYSPERPAFHGDSPITLFDSLSQMERWCIGLLEVAFSKYNPLIYGAKLIPLPLALSYANYSHWPMYGISTAIYGLVPPLALLNQIQLFPQFGDPWFYLYVYLFIGAYGQELLELLLEKGSFKRWWSDQRMWMIRGVSSLIFALAHFFLQLLGISGFGFNVTKKVLDEDHNQLYEQEIFEFGVSSPLFMSIATFSWINLIAFIVGIVVSIRCGSVNKLLVHILIAGFVVVNGLPIYEAMVLRKDRGKMPSKVVVSLFLLASTLSLLCVTQV